MNSDNTTSINETLKVMYESKEETYLQRSQLIAKQLDILVEDLSKRNETYSFNFVELIRFLRNHIHNLSNEYEKYKISGNKKDKYQQDLEDKIKQLTKKVYSLDLIIKLNEKEKSELKKEIEMLNKEIESLKNENKKNEIEKSEMKREIDNLKKNMDEDTKHKEEEISKLKIENGRFEIINEKLNTSIKEQEKLIKHNSKEINSQKQEIENLKENNRGLNKMFERYEKLESQLIGIQNRDNYKSIIYILLIYSGNNFKDIGGYVADLIQNNVNDKYIKGLLMQAYNYYDEQRLMAHNGFKSDIMKQLFPKSKFKGRINDCLINRIKDLLIKYENQRIYNEKKNEIDQEIDNITSEIKNLDLNN